MIMSANNYLAITKSKRGFIIYDLDADGGGGSIVPGGPFKTLEDAIQVANKYQEENVVEYGLQIDLGPIGPIYGKEVNTK